MDSLEDWVQDSQHGDHGFFTTCIEENTKSCESFNSSPCQITYNCSWEGMDVVDIWTAGDTEQRIKIRTKEFFGAGVFIWGVYVPTREENVQTSIGAFLYDDYYHEFDFEIAYGLKEHREKEKATNGDLIVYMSDHSYKIYNKTAIRDYTKIKAGGWYEFKLEIDKKPNGEYVATWHITDLSKPYLNNWDRGTYNSHPSPIKEFSGKQYHIYCSVENINGLGGTSLPTTALHGYFDYVEYLEPYDEQELTKVRFLDKETGASRFPM